MVQELQGQPLISSPMIDLVRRAAGLPERPTPTLDWRDALARLGVAAQLARDPLDQARQVLYRHGQPAVARVELADTLGQLREGLAPSALSSEAIALAKDSGVTLARTLANQARTNPVPALLIGAAQILFLDVPNHAAVDLSVRLAQDDRLEIGRAHV